MFLRAGIQLPSFAQDVIRNKPQAQLCAKCTQDCDEQRSEVKCLEGHRHCLACWNKHVSYLLLIKEVSPSRKECPFYKLFCPLKRCARPLHPLSFLYLNPENKKSLEELYMSRFFSFHERVNRTPTITKRLRSFFQKSALFERLFVQSERSLEDQVQRLELVAQKERENRKRKLRELKDRLAPFPSVASDKRHKQMIDNVNRFRRVAPLSLVHIYEGDIYGLLALVLKINDALVIVYEYLEEPAEVSEISNGLEVFGHEDDLTKNSKSSKSSKCSIRFPCPNISCQGVMLDKDEGCEITTRCNRMQCLECLFFYCMCCGASDCSFEHFYLFGSTSHCPFIELVDKSK